MPWYPELFSAPALARIEARRRLQRDERVPFFAGVMTGELAALVGSFAGPPELHHPVRGRVKGDQAFRRFAGDVKAWMERHDVAVEDVDVIVTRARAVEEVVLHVDVEGRRVELPVAIVNDRDAEGRIAEQRMYFSARPLRGSHAIRPPLLQPDASASPPDVVGDLQRALAAGDPDGAVAAFEPDGVVRRAAGGSDAHHAAGELRALFERSFADGGVVLEPCAVTDDGRACALEYNVVAWGQTRLPPQAGIAVHVRGAGGRLAAARTYDDVDQPQRVPAGSRS